MPDEREIALRALKDNDFITNLRDLISKAPLSPDVGNAALGIASMQQQSRLPGLNYQGELAGQRDRGSALQSLLGGDVSSAMGSGLIDFDTFQQSQLFPLKQKALKNELNDNDIQRDLLKANLELLKAKIKEMGNTDELDLERQRLELQQKEYKLRSDKLDKEILNGNQRKEIAKGLTDNPELQQAFINEDLSYSEIYALSKDQNKSKIMDDYLNDRNNPANIIRFVEEFPQAARYFLDNNEELSKTKKRAQQLREDIKTYFTTTDDFEKLAIEEGILKLVENAEDPMAARDKLMFEFSDQIFKDAGISFSSKELVNRVQNSSNKAEEITKISKELDELPDPIKNIISKGLKANFGMGFEEALQTLNAPGLMEKYADPFMESMNRTGITVPSSINTSFEKSFDIQNRQSGIVEPF